MSANIRVRVPEHLIVGEDSIIDDFCYISTRLTVGRGTHIASGCSIAGGAKFQCTIGDFCSLSSGVKVWCASNDFVNDLIAIVPEDIETSAAEGDVEIGSYSGVGANSVILPDNHLLKARRSARSVWSPRDSSSSRGWLRRHSDPTIRKRKPPARDGELAAADRAAG